MNYFNRNQKLLVLILYWVTAISPEVLPVNTSISSEGCLSGFEDLLPTSKYCYSINLSDLEKWHDAEEICKNISSYHGGHLATISSMQLNIAISNRIRNHDTKNITTEIWIGLQNVDIEKGKPSIWKWSDGSGLEFTNWVPGFPLTIRNDCTQLEWSRFNSSKWFNSPCSAKRHFICQAPRVLPGSKLIPECGVIGAPPVSPKTFQEYVIPFWFRESIFRQDADLGFLSDQSRSTDNTVACLWDYFLCVKRYGVWPSNKKCCSKRLKLCRKEMKINNEIVELGPDYTSSPLTIGDRWLTWPEEGTPPTVPSTLQIYQTTQSPKKSTNLMKTPPMNESCHTTGGGVEGVACVFPFIFRDKSRNSCIFEDSDSGEPWCSVQVDKDGYHIGNKGRWGYCASICPMDSSDPLILSSSPYTLSFGFNKSQPLLSNKTLEYSLKYNDNANTINTNSEEEKMQISITFNRIPDNVIQTHNVSYSTHSPLDDLNSNTATKSDRYNNETNGFSVFDSAIETNNSTATNSVTIIQLDKTTPSYDTHNSASWNDTTTVTSSSIKTPINGVNLVSTKVQKVINKTLPLQEMQNNKIKLKTKKFKKKQIKSTTKNKNVTKRKSVKRKTATKTSSSTKTNAKITKIRRTTTERTTTTKTAPTSAPTAFESLKRNILSLFPKNLDMNFNIFKIFDFLKSFVS